MKLFVLVVCFLLAVNPTFSQEGEAVNVEPKCWIASMSFSAGATARAGNQVMVCTPTGAWENTDEWASVCFREGDVYSVGAIERVTGHDDILLTCTDAGTWSSERSE